MYVGTTAKSGSCYDSCFLSRSTNHEEEVSKLYEEMERQIQGEKEKLIAQVRQQLKNKKNKETFWMHDLNLRHNKDADTSTVLYLSPLLDGKVARY